MEMFGEEHRKLRLANTDVTLREFAHRLGVNPSYLSNVEKGVEPPFTEELLKKSVRLMGLFGRDEQKLMILRVRTSEKARAEKIAFQVARRTRHLSEKEFEEIFRKARRLASKQQKEDTKK